MDRYLKLFEKVVILSLVALLRCPFRRAWYPH